MIFHNLFSRINRKLPERAVYEQIVAKARQPWLYAKAGVEDTLTGRFSMITLHMFLVLDRLNDEGEQSRQFSQKLFDEMFADMDRSLRELGVGDISVGKKVRKMSEVFYGSCEAYRTALAQPADSCKTALAAALKRNAAQTASKEQLDSLTGYVLRIRRAIAGLDAGSIRAGKLDYEGPSLED